MAANIMIGDILKCASGVGSFIPNKGEHGFSIGNNGNLGFVRRRNFNERIALVYSYIIYNRYQFIAYRRLPDGAYECDP